MQVKRKATWIDIKIPGNCQAQLAIVEGIEFGTIAKIGRTSAWNVFRGIGMQATFLGNSFSKEGAKFMLLAEER